MPKVNLTATYGYRDPATGERTYYGPGTNIEVPEGLARTLGLDILEQTEAAQAETTETQQVVEATEGAGDDLLPDNFPGRKYLVQARYTTLSSVRSLSIDDLIEIKGIGTRLAEQILERLKEDA